ncbi:Two-component sensor histidine kinase [Candidatus Terasakiella magnetica]|nr:Two-component sensor histidine kinase [Candidatus Terasakiella magnetica]
MTPWRRALIGLGMFLGYLALDWIEFSRAYTPLGLTPWDPSAGLALALLLVVGLELLPVLLLVELVSAVMTRGWPPPLPHSVAIAVVVTVCWGGLAALLGPRLNLRLATQRDLLLLTIATGAAALILALLVLGINAEGLPFKYEHLILSLGQAWIGDMIGVMVVTPLILVNRQALSWPGRAQALELGVIGIVTVGVLILIFKIFPYDDLQLFYLLFLPSIWVAARFGLRGATLINTVMQISLLVSFSVVVKDPGGVTEFQFRMLALTLSTLFLGTAVTERRRAEEDLRMRQSDLARFSRLSLAGEMAAALAHELNQPLSAAVTYTRAAQRLMGAPVVDQVKVMAAMDGAAAQAGRAAQIIRTLREFIGRGAVDRQAYPIVDLISDAVAVLTSEDGCAGSSILPMVEKGLPPVLADRVQIQQVLVNLIRNGIEAADQIPPPLRRPMVVSARLADCNEVMIEVADSGPGLSAEAAEWLFQPFSTTKATGMGLGLSICRTIIEAHGGRLWLELSTPQGCCFRFTVPVAKEKGISTLS